MTVTPDNPEPPRQTFNAWCQANGVADPKELASMAGYLGIRSEELVELARGRTGWVDRLRSRHAETVRRRQEWAGSFARRNVGPETFRQLTDEQILGKLPRQLEALVQKWTPDRNALVLGPTGVGKTMCACLLARRGFVSAMAKSSRWHQAADKIDVNWQSETEAWNFGVVWTAASDLARARKGHALGRGEAPAVTAALKADLLIIDDLGWEPTSDPVCGDILAGRYDAGRTTIATAGWGQADLGKRYGAAFLRRLTEVRGQKGLVVDMCPAPAVDRAA